MHRNIIRICAQNFGSRINNPLRIIGDNAFLPYLHRELGTIHKPNDDVFAIRRKHLSEILNLNPDIDVARNLTINFRNFPIVQNVPYFSARVHYAAGQITSPRLDQFPGGRF